MEIPKKNYAGNIKYLPIHDLIDFKSILRMFPNFRVIDLFKINSWSSGSFTIWPLMSNMPSHNLCRNFGWLHQNNLVIRAVW